MNDRLAAPEQIHPAEHTDGATEPEPGGQLPSEAIEQNQPAAAYPGNGRTAAPPQPGIQLDGLPVIIFEPGDGQAVATELPVKEETTVPPPPTEPTPVAIPTGRRTAPRWRTALFITLGVLAVLLLAAGGGWFYLRSTETRLLDEAQAQFKNSDWAAVEASCSQLLGLPSNLLAEPERCVPLRGEAYYRMGQFEPALADLQAAQARYPALTAPALLSAEIYLKQGSYDQALAAAAETEKRDPAAARPYMIAVEIYTLQNKPDQALAAAGEAQKRDDTLALPYTLQAADAYRRNDYKAAEKAAQAALARDAKQQPALRVLGSLQAWRAEFKAGLENLNQAITLDPKDQQALAERAMYYYLHDKEDAFQVDANAALALGDTSAAARVLQALQAAVRHDFQLSCDILGEAIKLDGTRPEYYYLRAYLNPSTQKSARGNLDDLDKALQINPSLYAAQYERLMALNRQYEKVDLLVEGDKLMKAAPESIWGEYLKLEYYADRQDWKQALEWAQKIVEKAPNARDSYAQRGWVWYNFEEDAKAEADFKKAIELDSTAVVARADLANLYARQNKQDEALKLREEIINLSPKQAWPYLQRYYSLSAKKETTKARADLDKALEIDPYYIPALKERVYLNIDAKDYTKAAEDIARIAEAEPKGPTAHTLKAYLYRVQKDYQRSLDEAKLAVEIYPFNANYYDQAAIASYFLDKYDDTLAFAGEALKVDSKNYTAAKWMAYAYYEKKDYDQTLAWGEKALALKKDDAWIYLTLADAGVAKGDYQMAASYLQASLVYIDQLDKDTAEQLEKDLFFYTSIPPLVNGRRTVTNNTNKFTLTYSKNWTPQPTDPEHKYEVLRLTAGGSNGVELIVEVDQIEAQYAYQVNLQLFADYYRQKFTSSGMIFSKRTVLNGSETIMLDMYTYNSKNSAGKTVVIVYQCYMFYYAGHFIMISVTGENAPTIDYLEEVVSVVTSLKFMK